MTMSSPNRFQCHFTWTIQKFKKHYGADLIDGEYVAKSPHFAAAKDTVSWFLQLHTEKKNRRHHHHRNITFYLECDRLKKHGPIMGQFEYSFTNSEGEKVNKDPIFFSLNRSEEPYVCIENFPPCVCSFRKMKCVHKDQVKIHCRVTYYRGAEVNSFFIDQPDALKENYEMFLDNEELSDIAVFVGEQKFPCHKIILATRSSVFKAMFTHNMKENSSNRVDIHDFDENIFQEVLRYIYTGKVDVLEETAFELLHAADMYDLADLKTLCEKKLGAMLAAENAVKILSASNTYHLENLKARAIEFIETNLNEIVDTDAWNELTSQPDVMKILLGKFAELVLWR